MQIVSCDVYLSGDRNHMVHKDEVTVAEVVLLQHLHGMDAVVNIQRRRMDRRSHAQERERLRANYKKKLVDQIFPNRPGQKLPVELSELDLTMAGGQEAAFDVDDLDDVEQQEQEALQREEEARKKAAAEEAAKKAAAEEAAKKAAAEEAAKKVADAQKAGPTKGKNGKSGKAKPETAPASNSAEQAGGGNGTGQTGDSYNADSVFDD